MRQGSLQIRRFFMDVDGPSSSFLKKSIYRKNHTLSTSEHYNGHKITCEAPHRRRLPPRLGNLHRAAEGCVRVDVRGSGSNFVTNSRKLAMIL